MLNILASKNEVSSLKSETRVYAVEGNKITAQIKRVSASGTPVFIRYGAAFDGKAYPVTGPRNRDTIALTKLDEHTVMSIVREGTKVTSLSRWVVSNDGKHLSVTRKSGSPRGKLVISTLIYDKK